MTDPDEAALMNVLSDLQNALKDTAATQRRLLEITGTAWSDDRLIKAVVGPRGQLIDLEIDPRATQRGNSQALGRTIVTVVKAAAENAMAQTREILAEDMPAALGDLGTSSLGGFDLMETAFMSDADLRRRVEGDSG